MSNERFEPLLFPKLAGADIDSSEIQKDIKKFEREIESKFGIKLGISTNFKEVTKETYAEMSELQKYVGQNAIALKFETPPTNEVKNKIRDFLSGLGNVDVMDLTPKIDDKAFNDIKSKAKKLGGYLKDAFDIHQKNRFRQGCKHNPIV